MDTIINLNTLDQLDVPNTVTFDVSSLVNTIDILVAGRNSSMDAMVEKGAARELLLKELAVTPDAIHLNDVDIYGVKPNELMDKFDNEIRKPLLSSFPYFVFVDLSLIDLRGTAAVYQLVTVEIDEDNYRYVS